MKNLFRFKFILLSIVTTSILSSCASPVVSERSIASEGESCREIFSKFFSRDNSAANKKITKNLEPVKTQDDLEPSFTMLLSKRSALKERYQKFVDSIADFNPAADRAIKGKAKLLIDPQEAYMAKIMMIKRAKYSVDVSYYIFHDDDSGRALLNELRLAIKRGVKVRIMLDSLGSVTNAPFYTDLKALMALRGGVIRNVNGELTNQRASAEAVIINPMINIRAHVSNWYNRVQNLFLDEGAKLPITSISMNRRSHDKILMIDSNSVEDSMAIIGGRNMANYYYDLGKSKNNTFQDLEILVKNITKVDDDGTSHNSLENYYNKVFYYLANKNLESFLMKINRNSARKAFKKMRSGSREIFSPENMGLEKEMVRLETEKFLDNDFEEGMVSIVHELQNFSRVKAFLTPHSIKNKANADSLMGKLTEEMKQAKKSICISSPYLWLSDDDIAFLKRWLAEDSSRVLKVISNSIGTTDNVPAQAMVDTILGPKLVTELEGDPIASQIKVYAYGKMDDTTLGGTVEYGKLHAKFTIIDENKVLVSTSNLDPRSRYLNSELGVFFEGKDGMMASNLQAYFDKLVNMSYEWGSPEWKQARELKENRVAMTLQKFVGKIIHFFNLVPLI